MVNFSIAKSQSVSATVEGHFLQGKIEQVRGNYDAAFESFKKAFTLKPKCTPIQFSYGQMLMYKNENDKAIEVFRGILESEPTNIEVLKRLASIYHKKPETTGILAVECFNKINSILKTGDLNGAGLDDADLLIEFGRLKEGVDHKAALQVYQNAKAALDARKERARPELLNNIGALYHYEGNLLNAKKFYTLAQEEIKFINETTGSSRNTDYTNTTVLYNIGRLYEAERNLDRAEEFYKRINLEHPAYYDAYIRMGALLLEKGKYNEAEDKFKDVFVMDSKNVDAHLMLGKTMLLMGDHKNSRKTYEKLLKEIDSRNTYALCAVGNLNVHFARIDPKMKEIHLKRAFEFFDKALRHDDKNFVAAIGIGICLAEKGRLVEAKETFSQVQSAINSVAATINLAHVLVDLGQPRGAAVLYESALKKQQHERNDSLIYQYIARSHYIIGKSEKDPEAMRNALNYIQKAARSNPKDLALFFDIALLKQQYAQVLNEQPIERRPLDLLKKTAAGLESSRRIFAGLAEMPPSSNLGYDIKQAKDRADYCKDVKRVSDKKIHETEVLEKQRAERLQAIKEEQMRNELRHRQEEARKAEEKRREEEALVERRKRLNAQMIELNEAAALADPDEDEKREKRERKAAAADGYVSSDSESQSTTKKKRSKKAKREADDGTENGEEEGGSGGGGGGGSSTKAARKRVIGDSDDEEEGGEAVTAKKKKIDGKKSALSAAFIDDSDED